MRLALWTVAACVFTNELLPPILGIVLNEMEVQSAVQNSIWFQTNK